MKESLKEFTLKIITNNSKDVETVRYITLFLVANWFLSLQQKECGELIGPCGKLISLGGKLIVLGGKLIFKFTTKRNSKGW